MVRRPQRVSALLVLLAAGLAVSVALASAAEVTLQPAERYQTILGWGKTTPWAPTDPLLRDLVIERSVNDCGLNRLRFEGLCGNNTRFRSWEWRNDNEDPLATNWSGFSTAHLDARVSEWLVPWKRAVEARGEPFDLYVSPSFFRGGSSGDVPPWLLADPEEYAEWACALLQRLRDTHGITAPWYSICNEAGNNNAFTSAVVGRLIKTVVPRFRQLGLPTRIQFCESVNAAVAWRYVQDLRGDPLVWDPVGVISYHWYGRDNQTSMVLLRDFAKERGLPTAQTEFMTLTIDHLYDDLTLGGVSYWEVYGLCGPDYEAALSHLSSTTYRGGDWYWRFRQASRYVRPGAVRIGAASTDPALRVLACERDGRPTVLLINTGQPRAPRSVTVGPLPAGRYAVSQAVGRAIYQELGVRDVAGSLAVDVPADSVLTISPAPATNAAPVVTEWRTEPQFLTAPAAALELRCAATDVETDPLAATWAVVRQPAGAAVAIARPDGFTTRATGLSVPGDYLFGVRVTDGHQTVERQLLVKVFEGNQPPVPNDVHNRMPVQVTVKDGGTLLRAGAWDIEHDPVTLRWSLVSAPAGAAPALEPGGSPGACRVTGLTVAGDYVFRLEASDPTHTVTVDHTVPVYP